MGACREESVHESMILMDNYEFVNCTSARVTVTRHRRINIHSTAMDIHHMTSIQDASHVQVQQPKRVRE